MDAVSVENLLNFLNLNVNSKISICLFKDVELAKLRNELLIELNVSFYKKAFSL